MSEQPKENPKSLVIEGIKETIEEVKETIDTNKDGIVSRAEFEAYMNISKAQIDEFVKRNLPQGEFAQGLKEYGLLYAYIVMLFCIMLYKVYIGEFMSSDLILAIISSGSFLLTGRIKKESQIAQTGDIQRYDAMVLSKNEEIAKRDQVILQQQRKIFELEAKLSK